MSHSDCYCYCWKIPSMCNDTKMLLCIGYAKINYAKYIIEPIIHLFSCYYTNDEYTLNDIKNASNSQKFLSPIFKIASFQWYLELFPAGAIKRNEGKVMLFLCLVSNPPNLSKIYIKYKFECAETKTIYYSPSRLFKYDKNANNQWYSCWPADTLSSNNIANIKQLTIYVSINLLEIYNSSNKVISELYMKQHQLTSKNDLNTSQFFLNQKFNLNPLISNIFPRVIYNWNISDKNLLNKISCASCGDYISSSGFKIGSTTWYLQLAPNGKVIRRNGFVDLFFILNVLPPNIKQISIKYKINMRNTTKNIGKWSGIHHAKHSNFAYRWRCDNIKNQDIINSNEINIDLEIIVLEVYDKNGNIIENFLNNQTTETETMKAETVPLKLPMIFEYVIDNPLILKEIKNAVPEQAFYFPPFETYYNLKWYLVLYPNTQSDSYNKSEKENKEFVRIFLNLISTPPNINKIYTRDTLILKETNNEWTTTHDFDRNDASWGWRSVLKLKDIYDIKKLSFKLKLMITNIFDKHNNSMILPVLNKNILSTKPILLSPSSIFIWSIKDKYTISQIKNTKDCVSAFASPIFTAHSLKWYIDFWPRGSRETRSNEINMFLNLLSILPSNIEAYIFQIDVYFIEINKKRTIYPKFTQNNTCQSASKWPINRNDINNMESFTVKIDIRLCDVYENDKIITNKYFDNNNENKKNYDTGIIHVPSAKYIWKIPLYELRILQAANYVGTGYKSKIFEMYQMKWRLEVRPNRDKQLFIDILIYNESLLLLPDNNNVSISIRYTIIVSETNTKFIDTAIFTKKNNVLSWGPERLSTQKFNNLNTATIKLNIELIDGTNIYDKFQTINNKIDELIQIINDDLIYIQSLDFYS